jgi:anaerobic selenocysteine-containing dehydrogenase
MASVEMASVEPHPAKTLATACPLDCPDSCSLQVTVEDGRVVRLEGDERNPLTAGFICSKVRRFPRHLYGEERLLYPMRRTGPRGESTFERISWEVALDLVAARMRKAREEHGSESVLPFSYGGCNGSLTQDTTDARLFRRFGASRLARTVCAAPSGRAASGLYGKFPGIALEDYIHSKLIVVWGANPSASGIHHVPILREAQRRGARLVVIDPRSIPMAKHADLHLRLRPGTDLPVALAVLSWLFEHGHADLEFLNQHTTGADELRRRASDWSLDRAAQVAGLETAQIEQFARLYAEASPAAVRCGWGPERNRNGGSAIAAILALPAVAGKFGVRGGGYTMSNSGAWKLDPTTVDGEEEASTRLINMNLLGETLLQATPPVQMLFVYNCNPLMTLPDQEKVRAGLSREDLFTVVFEQVMTDTALFADLVLPATTFLEHQDLRAGYGTMATQEVRPVIAPVGEARPNFEVFGELVERLGLSRPGDLNNEDAFTAALLEQEGVPSHDREALRADRPIYPKTGPRPIQFVDSFPFTSDRKIHLVPSALDQEAPEGLYAYRRDLRSKNFPLALISPSTSRTVSSTFGQLYKEQVALQLDPVDADARGLSNGDRVRVFNELGEVHCPVRITSDLKPGTALLPKGLWSHNTENGRTSNALSPATLTDLGGGACFNDARVDVEKL